MAAGALPAPEWRSAGNTAYATLRMRAEQAAAYRVAFLSLNLPEGTQLYLHGLDANGRKISSDGPYYDYGPQNIPSFQSALLEGSSLLIEVVGERIPQWPFALRWVERFDAGALASLKQDGIEFKASNVPLRRVRVRNVETRTAWVEDRLVPYQETDGLAISGGDMILGVPGEGSAQKGGERNSFAIANKRWPGGVMPYEIDGWLKALYAGKHSIPKAVEYWNSKFPGTMVPRTNQTNFVRFVYKLGVCRATVGMAGGMQLIEGDDNCDIATYVHEIGHAFGLWHEHTRTDRDSYVKIHWDNIEAGQAYNFEIPSDHAPPPTPYDFASIMHYSTSSFAKDKTKPTISFLVQPPQGVNVGAATGVSDGDIAGMKARYCVANLYVYTPATVNIDWDGGAYAVQVKAPSYCPWTVTESSTWFSLSGKVSGVGTGTFFVNAGAYTNPKPRAATITVKSVTGVAGISVVQTSE